VKRKSLLIVLAGFLLGLAVYYVYGGSAVPAGQPSLVSLNSSNLAALKESFNQSAESVRVIVMLSPT
jgi:hypothetical protein